MNEETAKTTRPSHQTGGVKIFYPVLMLMLLVVVVPTVGLQQFMQIQHGVVIKDAPSPVGIAILCALGCAFLVGTAMMTKLMKLTEMVHLASNARTIGEVHRCEKVLASLGGLFEVRLASRSILQMIAALKSPSRKASNDNR